MCIQLLHQYSCAVEYVYALIKYIANFRLLHLNAWYLITLTVSTELYVLQLVELLKERRFIA